MKFVSTSKLGEQVLEQFFEDKWEQFESKTNLLEHGYLVEYKQEYKAYFALSPVEENSYWLKSLYIKEGVPTAFPLAIIEAAIALANEKAASNLYVCSHQQSLNSLLSLLNFESHLVPHFAWDEIKDNGEWWRIDPAKVPHVNT
ncbi:hypothetical protein [Aquibacillus saliphilus]|uniref:hypothetical protein n=1 Tax=Aquibacillus saliphilus TaxID=1909422 RepID=UPI001CF01800|nr:hypothetical protein [Aquibacillus saliphilus]